MDKQTYTLTFTDQDIKAMNILVFTLNLLSRHENRVDELEEGLSAVVETAREKADALIGRLYQAVWETTEAQ